MQERGTFNVQDTIALTGVTVGALGLELHSSLAIRWIGLVVAAVGFV